MVKKYYLKLATVVIRFDVPTSLYLFDDWSKLFQETILPFQTKSNKSDFVIKLTGTTLNRFRVNQKKINSPVPQPYARGKTLYFNNLLHPRYLLTKLADLIRVDLAKRGLFMLHASGVAISKKEAILFTGPSGCGKSTCLKKLSPILPPLGDDILVIGLKNKNVVCYPYPINLKVDYSKTVNGEYGVSGIALPEPGNLSLTKLSPTTDTILRILNQIMYVPNKKETVKILNITNALNNSCYSLTHRLDDNISPLLHTVRRCAIPSRRT